MIASEVVMEYQIVMRSAAKALGTDFEAAARELEQLVAELIRQGWKPLGGVAVGNTQSVHNPYLFQAMTRG
jgi:hypothetical protein